MEVLIELAARGLIWVLQCFHILRSIKVVFECPNCRALEIARQREVVTRDEKRNLAYGGEEFVCTECKRAFPTEFFEADADGVYKYLNGARRGYRN